MAEKSSFFNSVNGDRRYLASDFADFFSPLVTNGFFPSNLNLKVFADKGNMDITVKSGRAWINGYMYSNTGDLSLTLDVADGVLYRIDRVVVQLSFLDRAIRTVVKKGTPASNPYPPAIQRNADVFELGIATVYVGAGITSISGSNITDTRYDVTVGGIVNNMFADASVQGDAVKLDDQNNYYVSENLEGALIELAQPLTVNKSGYDVNAIFTNIVFTNPAGVNVKQSLLSNPDSEGNYLVRTVSYFGIDGVTVVRKEVYDLIYNADGNIVSEVLR